MIIAPLFKRNRIYSNLKKILPREIAPEIIKVLPGRLGHGLDKNFVRN